MGGSNLFERIFSAIESSLWTYDNVETGLFLFKFPFIFSSQYLSISEMDLGSTVISVISKTPSFKNLIESSLNPFTLIFSFKLMLILSFEIIFLKE